MRKRIDRKKLILIFSIFFISVISLSVVYAALSTTLNISGSSKVNASNWKLEVTKQTMHDATYGTEFFEWCNYYDCSLTYQISGTASVNNTGSISGTTISDIEISFLKPGDNLTLYYNIKNVGTIPAVYKSVNNFIPVITSESGNADDVKFVEQNFSFTSSLGSYTVGNAPIDFVLCPNESIMLGVWASINNAANTVPSSRVTISNLGAEFVFTQGDLSLCI